VAEHHRILLHRKRAALGRGAQLPQAHAQGIALHVSTVSLPALQLAASIDAFTIDHLNVEIDDGSLDGRKRFSLLSAQFLNISLATAGAAVAQQLVRMYSNCRGGNVTEALQYTNADKVAAAAALSPSPHHSSLVLFFTL
jgi:hypothetical protein